MTAPNLKPCPFCGGIAYLRDDASHSTAYFIGCATEDCFGEIHWGQNEAEAVTAWNTRAPLAEALAVPEVRALVKCLQREPTLTWIVENTSQVRIRDLALDMLEQQRAALRAIGEGKA